MDSLIDGIILADLKRIPNPKGDIYHALKVDEPGYEKFGEAYFSIVNHGIIKGWKKHTKMVLNLIVPIGAVQFVIYDDRKDSKTNGFFFSVEISPDNYKRLTVPPGVWMAFRGVGEQTNMLLNIASIKHDPDEAENQDLDGISYDW